MATTAGIYKRGQWETREGKPQTCPWDGYVNFTKVIFRPIKRLKFMRVGFRRRAQFHLIYMSRENNGALCSLDFSPLKYSAMFALWQSRVDSMTFQTID